MVLTKVLTIQRKFLQIGLLGLLFTLVVSGCSQPEPIQPPEQTAAPLPTATIPATGTPVPTPAPQQKAVMVGMEGNQNGLPQGMQEVIQKLSLEQGWLFETSADFASLGDTEGVQIVVASSLDAGLAPFAAEHLQIKILALGAPGLELTDQMGLVNLQGGSADQLGFLAGYISAVITKDWRVGVISQAETPAGKAARQGFINGVIFYCGLCRPIYPPFYQYPVYTEIQVGAAADVQQVAVDTIVNSAVQTVYVAPEVAEDALLESLAKAGVRIIGGRSASVVAGEQWVATLQADWSAPVVEAWNKLINGEGGFQLDAPIRMSDANSQYLSAGRQRLIEQVLQDLLAGYIDTGVDPATGELR